MSGNDKPEPTQKTPKGEEIPIPRRKDFIDNLKKVTKKPDASTPDRPKD